MTSGAVLVVMCGLSFSGKSTLAGGLSRELPAEVVSLDAINAERDLSGGQGIPLGEWAETNRIAHARAHAHLGAGRHVIVDDTGSPRFIRNGWRRLADDEGAGFALVWIHIAADLQRERVEVNRIERRRDDVIDEVLDEHIAGFDAPDDEDPIVVDASDVADEPTVRRTAEAIRRTPRSRP